MKIDTTAVNEIVHRTVFEDVEMRRILANAVAEELGIALDRPGVKLRTFEVLSSDGPTGPKYRVKVEIVQDRTPAAPSAVDGTQEIKGAAS